MKREFRISDQVRSSEALVNASPGLYSSYIIPKVIPDNFAHTFGAGRAFANDWSQDGTVSLVVVVNDDGSIRAL